MHGAHKRERRTDLLEDLHEADVELVDERALLAERLLLPRVADDQVRQVQLDALPLVSWQGPPLVADHRFQDLHISRQGCTSLNLEGKLGCVTDKLQALDDLFGGRQPILSSVGMPTWLAESNSSVTLSGIEICRQRIPPHTPLQLPNILGGFTVGRCECMSTRAQACAASRPRGMFSCKLLHQ